MKPTLHVGSAQIVARVDDLPGNLASILSFAEEAYQAGVGALLFSECMLQGSSVAPKAIRQAVAVDGPECLAIAAAARSLRMMLMVGFIEQAGAQVFNSYFIAYADGHVQVQRKLALNQDELTAGMTPGPVERLPLRIPGWNARMVICADAGSPPIQAELDRVGCDLVFLGTAGGGTVAGMLRAAELDTPEGVQRYAERMARVAVPIGSIADARRKRRALVTCNSVGDNGCDACHEGHCILIDGDGCLVGLIPGAPVLEFQRSRLVHAVLKV